MAPGGGRAQTRPLPAVAVLDAFFSWYGWDFWTYRQQPEWLIEELMTYRTARQEAEAIRTLQRMGKGSPGLGSGLPWRAQAEALRHRSTGALLSEAAEQGFDVPELPG